MPPKKALGGGGGKGGGGGGASNGGGGSDGGGAHLKKMKGLLVPVGATLIPSMGGLYGTYYLRKEYRYWYQNLNKPKWAAPFSLFFPITNAMYPAMGFASFLVYVDGPGCSGRAKVAMYVYGGQLILCWTWPTIMFKHHRIGTALANSVLLSGMMSLCVAEFYKINKTAGLLMVPGLLWTFYVTLTNAAIFKRNQPTVAKK